MTISDDLATALVSDLGLVTVEAPAGCGKTYQAADLALRLTHQLRPGQEILLLTHTNAAVRELQHKAARRRRRVHAATLDAFALQLAAPYATNLGLQVPLRVAHPDGVAFKDLARAAARLLRKAPRVAAAIAGHYPVVILDEHQDARLVQHEMARLLADASTNPHPARLRIFGDPCQAIYGFEDDEAMADWHDIVGDADFAGEMTTPHRWKANPQLGRWMLTARRALFSNRPLPLDSAPSDVQVQWLDELDELPNPQRSQPVRAVIGPLHRALNDKDGSVAVLADTNAYVRGLRRAASRRLAIQEGSDVELASQALEQASDRAGEPQPMAHALLDLLRETATGFTAQAYDQVARRLTTGKVDLRRQRKYLTFLQLFEPLYDQPTLVVWCQTAGQILRHPPPEVYIDLPANFRVLASLRPPPDEDPQLSLQAALQQRRHTYSVPTRCASTIHKAKGQQYDHVIIPYCTARRFPDTRRARRLLYVAITRAQQSLTLMVSTEHPSPLIPPADT